MNTRPIATLLSCLSFLKTTFLPSSRPCSVFQVPPRSYVNSLQKRLHLRCLTGFCICLWQSALLSLDLFFQFTFSKGHHNLRFGDLLVWKVRSHLLVQCRQWEHQNNVWYLLSVYNKDNRKTSLMSFWCLYC